MWSSSKSLGKSEAGFSLGTMCHSSAPSPAPCKALLMYRLRALAEKYPVNATMYSCSTTLVENSSLRVNWEQFVTDCEERASILGVWSEVDSAPPSPSIPTTGRKPAISPKSMDTHAERRSILSCEVVLTISLTEPTGWLRVSRSEVPTEHFRSTVPQMSP